MAPPAQERDDTDRTKVAADGLAAEDDGLRTFRGLTIALPAGGIVWAGLIGAAAAIF